MSALALFASLLVLQTPSTGKLQIKDITVGKGPAVKIGDQISVDYTGKLTNGTIFDTSKGKKPYVFIVGAQQVIKGWDQGLIGAKVGGKRKLTLPYHLGYGVQGDPPKIPGKSTLVFDVEVKKIETVKIQVLKKGKGAVAMGGDTVTVHATGTFPGGKKFWSSRDDNQPMDLVLGKPGLVAGFTMGILGMKVGEKRKVTIPSALGYGVAGRPPVIPGNSTLVFELELMKLTK